VDPSSYADVPCNADDEEEAHGFQHDVAREALSEWSEAFVVANENHQHQPLVTEQESDEMKKSLGVVEQVYDHCWE
jgi:hypothetical protein